MLKNCLSKAVNKIPTKAGEMLFRSKKCKKEVRRVVFVTKAKKGFYDKKRHLRIKAPAPMGG